ncbi:hypothetical protein BD410DRAFT_824072, partial [Rickenella mellea]
MPRDPPNKHANPSAAYNHPPYPALSMPMSQGHASPNSAQGFGQGATSSSHHASPNASPPIHPSPLDSPQLQHPQHQLHPQQGGLASPTEQQSPQQQQQQNQQQQNQQQTAPKKKHVCPTCERAFTTSGHLARHTRVHTGERNHKCPFPGCETRCSRQDNLQQ